MGEDEDVIKLLDEDGAEHEFNVVDVLDVGDQRYAILQPVAEGQDADTAVIFRMEDEALVTIEDDAEFERVRQAFEESHDDEGEPLADDASGDHELPSEDHGSTAH